MWNTGWWNDDDDWNFDLMTGRVWTGIFSHDAITQIWKVGLCVVILFNSSTNNLDRWLGRNKTTNLLIVVKKCKFGIFSLTPEIDVSCYFPRQAAVYPVDPTLSLRHAGVLDISWALTDVRSSRSTGSSSKSSQRAASFLSSQAISSSVARDGVQCSILVKCWIWLSIITVQCEWDNNWNYSYKKSLTVFKPSQKIRIPKIWGQ